MVWGILCWILVIPMVVTSRRVLRIAFHTTIFSLLHCLIISQGHFKNEYSCVLSFCVTHILCVNATHSQACFCLHKHLSITQIPLICLELISEALNHLHCSYWIVSKFSIIYFSLAPSKTQLPSKGFSEVKLKRGINMCILHAMYVCFNPQHIPVK